jgi:hypothetical protein
MKVSAHRERRRDSSPSLTVGASAGGRGDADVRWNDTRMRNSERNLESRAKDCALDKVPHLKSSPDGRREEQRAELCKGLVQVEGKKWRAVRRGFPQKSGNWIRGVFLTRRSTTSVGGAFPSWGEAIEELGAEDDCAVADC